jgi:hypothetical protein
MHVSFCRVKSRINYTQTEIACGNTLRPENAVRNKRKSLYACVEVRLYTEPLFYPQDRTETKSNLPHSATYSTETAAYLDTLAGVILKQNHYGQEWIDNCSKCRFYGQVSSMRKFMSLPRLQRDFRYSGQATSFGQSRTFRARKRQSGLQDLPRLVLSRTLTG